VDVDGSGKGLSGIWLRLMILLKGYHVRESEIYNDLIHRKSVYLLTRWEDTPARAFQQPFPYDEMKINDLPLIAKLIKSFLSIFTLI
jgi:hypothetical protein